MADGAQRMARLRQLVDSEPPAHGATSPAMGHLHRICTAAARSIPAAGTSVTLMDREALPTSTIAASGDRFRGLEELQFALGEGPSIDAYALRGPVLEPQLLVDGLRRWPAYTQAARQLGVRAVFAFPLQVGAARLGVLGIYRDEPGALTPEAVSDALGFARLCLSTLLVGQVDGADGRLEDGLSAAVRERSEVYQAQGAVMIQLGATLPEAMARLRAYAYARDLVLIDVARDVLAGNIMFSSDDQ